MESSMFEIWWLLIATGLGLLLWSFYQARTAASDGQAATSLPRRSSEWHDRGRELGLDAAEIGLVEHLLLQDESIDGERLLNSRIAFESALERTLQGGSDLFQDLEMRRALDRLRLRRGWEVCGEVSQRGMSPMEEDELHIEGPGGSCLRSVLIHKDEQSIALRVQGSHGFSSGTPDWTPGTSVEVSWFQPESGCLTFESRVQELRDLGDWFLFLESPQQIRIQQRRQYLRTPLEGRFRFLRLSMGESGSIMDEPEGIHVGGVLDVGAGGAAIVTETPLGHQDLLVLRDFPGLEDLDLTARVVDIPTGEDADNLVYGIRFIGLSATARDALAQFVFAKRSRELPETTECALPLPELGADSTHNG